MGWFDGKSGTRDGEHLESNLAAIDNKFEADNEHCQVCYIW
jgi:hypothetical protein